MSITQSRLKELLHYDPETGIFTNRTTRSHNSREGSIAGGHDGKGYYITKIDMKRYFLHRLAFLYMTGIMPKGVTDHIDHDTQNNKWNNLRDVSRQDNAKNKTMNPRNTSNSTGVSFCKSRGKYVAQIAIDGKNTNLGRYNTKEEAIQARGEAEVKHDYHINHGT